MTPEAVVQGLKSLLKMRGQTYATLAESIALSESSVKRLFAENTFTLKRLLQICDVLQVDLKDLANIVVGETAELPDVLSCDQELELASSQKLFAVFYLTTRQWTFAEMTKRLQIPANELTRLMLRLDKIGLIDLVTDNRYRLRVRRDFRPRKGGPLAEFYVTKVKEAFLKDSFDEHEAKDNFLVGEVSKHSWDKILRRVDQLSNEIRSLLASDSVLPKNQTRSVGLLFLAKPWIYTPLFGKSPKEVS